MFQSVIIGNLGANVELHVESGNEFITFKVAHTERNKNADGSETETTVWVSCIMNGRADKLRQYLTKGTRVCVIGDTSLKTYHSKKMQRLVAGCNLFVRSIELVGGRTDDVPRYLFTEDGVQHEVGKFYFCGTAKKVSLYDRNGVEFKVDKDGWVTPTQTVTDDNQAEAQNG